MLDHKHMMVCCIRKAMIVLNRQYQIYQWSENIVRTHVNAKSIRFQMRCMTRARKAWGWKLGAFWPLASANLASVQFLHGHGFLLLSHNLCFWCVETSIAWKRIVKPPMHISKHILSAWIVSHLWDKIFSSTTIIIFDRFYKLGFLLWEDLGFFRVNWL